MKKIGKRLLCLLLAAALTGAGAAFAREGESVLDEGALTAMVEQYIQEKNLDPDNISVGYVYTATGDRWLYNEAQWYYSASCYKVPLMMMLAEKEHQGELSRESQVMGLQLGYAEESVLVYSHNDFAHLMMHFFGTDWECREGYQKYSDMPKEDYHEDFYNYSYFNIRFLTDVMETLYNEPERFPNIIDCLKRAQPDDYFHGCLGDRFEVAQKYGSYKSEYGDQNEWNNTAGIIYTPNPIVLVVMTKDLSVQKGEQVIQDLCLRFVDYTLALDEAIAQAEEERLRAEEEERLRAEEEERLRAEATEAPAESAAPAAPAMTDPGRISPHRQTAGQAGLLLALALVVALAAGVGLVVAGLLTRRRKAPVRRRRAAQDDDDYGAYEEYDDYEDYEDYDEPGESREEDEAPALRH